MKKLTGVSVAVVLAVVFAGCGESGPLTLSLASTQRDSGENRAVADSSMIAPDFSSTTVDYVPIGNLGPVPETAQAWSISKYGEAMRETQRIADGLGLDAQAKRSSDDKYVFLAEDKTSGATVTLWNHLAIGGWWSYSSSSGGGVSSSPACPPDDRSCVVEPQPAPPTNLLSTDEALARTNNYLEQAKFTVSDYVLSAQRNDWSTDVTGVVHIDGIATNITVMFSYGQDGVLNYASGPVMTFSPADTYPLVAIETAIERLSQPQYGFFGVATRMAADVAVSDSQASAGETIPLSIPLTGVRLTLMESNLSNGTHVLLPAFTFSNADGDVGTVLAITDEFLVFPKLDNPPTDNPGTPEPSPDAPVVPLTGESSATLIGLTEEEATKVATGNGWAVRIAMRDGTAFSLTMDYRQDRVNLVVVKNLVTKVDIG